jgi:hypothetical protein
VIVELIDPAFFAWTGDYRLVFSFVDGNINASYYSVDVVIFYKEFSLTSA